MSAALRSSTEGCRADDLPRSMSEQVDRIVDAASPFQGHRVDGNAQGLRKLLCVERLRRRREGNCALEQPPLHIVANETCAELARAHPARTPARWTQGDRERAASGDLRRSSRPPRRRACRDRPAATSPPRASQAAQVLAPRPFCGTSIRARPRTHHRTARADARARIRTACEFGPSASSGIAPVACTRCPACSASFPSSPPRASRSCAMRAARKSHGIPARFKVIGALGGCSAELAAHERLARSEIIFRRVRGVVHEE